MKTLDSGHIGPLFVVKIDHFSSPNRTRLTLSESLRSKPWFECDIHHSIACIDDPRIDDRIRLSLNSARPSFRARPGFYDCRIDIHGDYFLFIDSSKGDPARLLTNTTCVLISDLSFFLFTIHLVPSSTPKQGTVHDHIQGSTTGDSSMADTDDKGKPGRQRRRSKKNRDKISSPTPLNDSLTLPSSIQEKPVDTNNITLSNSASVSSTAGPKGFSVTSAQQAPRNTEKEKTAAQGLLPVPQVGTLS
jgi:hypothetical protein